MQIQKLAISALILKIDDQAVICDLAFSGHVKDTSLLALDKMFKAKLDFNVPLFK